jgi:hypothetical protein
VRRSKLGLDLDLVATKHWLAPTGLLRVPPLLKPSVRQIPEGERTQDPWPCAQRGKEPGELAGVPCYTSLAGAERCK